MDWPSFRDRLSKVGKSLWCVQNVDAEGATHPAISERVERVMVMRFGLIGLGAAGRLRKAALASCARLRADCRFRFGSDPHGRHQPQRGGISFRRGIAEIGFM